MQEFDVNDSLKLQEVEGYLLRDVGPDHLEVAIGDGFDYEDAYDFMADYIEDYGIDSLSHKMGFSETGDFLRGFTELYFDYDRLIDGLVEHFGGLWADELPDSYTQEAKENLNLGMQEEKTDRERGK